MSETLRIEKAGTGNALVWKDGPETRVFLIPQPHLSPQQIVGTRVTRGPSWKWGTQGGKNPEGIVTEIHPDGDDWVIVSWDNGEREAYRWGAENAYDLAPIPPVPRTFLARLRAAFKRKS